MSQLVVLNFAKGSLQQGFPEVTTQLWEGGSAMPTQFTGSLPASLELLDLYQKWRSLYEALHARLSLRRTRTTFEIDEADITNISEAEFSHLCQQIKSQLNRWLNSDGFGKVERQLRANLSRSAEIRVVITTEDPHLRKFPWHLWNFFEDYSYAEIALGTQNYEQPRPPRRSSTKLVKILAVLGNSEGIDTHRDREFLDQLPGAGTVFLAEPPRWELNHRLWDEKGWDILFFAGHSFSRVDGESGEIAINQTESLTIDQLKNALKAAIARGLKLAIFNSCDGLGLARAMADLNIPQLIVMREPVPDRVAQEFLKHFLTAFSGGQSLYRSVREAREQLEGLEDEYPSASWLPVICQNPAASPPTWKGLRDGSTEEPTVIPFRKHLRTMILASAAVVAAIVGIRQLGILEPLELQAYDQLVRMRPSEKPDSRLLIITVTGKDVNAQTEKQGSLSNRTLSKLLDKLESYNPALIGVDIYRRYPTDAESKSLADRLRNDQKLISACEIPNRREENLGYSPPAEVPSEQVKDRVGFTNVVFDEPGGTIRRFLLVQGLDSTCPTPTALSRQLALRYLAQEKDIVWQWTKSNDDLQIGQVGGVVFQRLTMDAGGYHQKDNERGYQVLLNYRALDNLNKIAPILTLEEAMNGKLSSELVKGRIVLIGTIDPRSRDLHFTPYNQKSSQRLPGVILQAHMLSQILSAVLDKRPLLWWWAEWEETVWIGVWSVVGGLVAWRFRSLISIGVGTGAVLAVLSGSCYLLLIQGGWVPLVPPMLALLVTEGIFVAYIRLQMNQSQSN